MFLWCIDKTTKEYDAEGTQYGLVLGGKPIKADEIAEDLGGSSKQIQRTLQKLADAGYLSLKRAPYGMIIEVLKSKKFVRRRDTNVPSGGDMNVPSPPIRGDTDVPSDAERKDVDVPSGQDINVPSEERRDIDVPSRQDMDVPSNKTLQFDFSSKAEEAASPLLEFLEGNAGSEVPPLTGNSIEEQLGINQLDRDFSDISEYVRAYLGKHWLDGFDIQCLQEMLAKGVSRDTILTAFNKTAERYGERNGGQRFGNFRYAKKPIYELHAAKIQIAEGVQQVIPTAEPIVPAHRPQDPILLEKRKRIEAMQSGNAGTFGRPPA